MIFYCKTYTGGFSLFFTGPVLNDNKSHRNFCRRFLVAFVIFINILHPCIGVWCDGFQFGLDIV